MNNGSKFYAKMFDVFETEVLYSLVRSIKPRNIIEFSPNAGWTSFVMLAACKQNAIDDMNYSVNIKSFDLISSSLNCNYNSNRVKRELYVGDALENVPKYIDSCDFLFIDSDHSKAFAEKYCQSIIKNYNGGYIWIHDWNGYNDSHNSGEVTAVKQYINSLGDKSIYPVINLMDYFLKVMSDEERKNLHERRFCWGGRNDNLDDMGHRSPSQILYKF